MRIAGWALIATTLAIALAPGVRAQDSVETAQRKQAEELERQARERRAEAQRLRLQENKELTNLRRTDRQLNATRSRLRKLDQKRHTLDNQLDATRVDLVRSRSALDLQKQKLALRLRNIYKYGSERNLEFLLSTQSFAQLLARWDFLVMVAEQDRLLVEDVMAKKAMVEASEQRLTTNLTEVTRTTQTTNRESARLSTLRQQKSGIVKVIQTQREAHEAAAADLERTARSIRRLLAELERKRQAESDKARTEGRAPQPYTGDFARGEGRLDWPVRGDIVGRFGTETSPKWGTVTMNNGIDIETPIGTPVRSVAKGRVDYTSDDFGSYGQMVVVNHGDGYYTLYAHLSSINVAVGTEVAPGQTVGLSGDSGSLKGPILHFEVRKGAQSLNPQQWLR